MLYCEQGLKIHVGQGEWYVWWLFLSGRITYALHSRENCRPLNVNIDYRLMFAVFAKGLTMLMTYDFLQRLSIDDNLDGSSDIGLKALP